MKKISRKTLGVLFTLLLLVPLSSCDEEVESGRISDLEVLVTGTFSGEKREGINVNAYLSKEDAQAEINPATATVITNVDGLAYLYNLQSNTVYWIKIHAPLFSTKIRKTHRLKPGENDFGLTITKF